MNHPLRRCRARGLGAAGLIAASAWLPLAQAQSVAPTPPNAAPPGEAASSAPAAAQRLPVEAFAALPLLTQVTLSPDGKRIAAVVNQQDQSVLITQAVAGKKFDSVLQTDNQKFHFRWVRWVNDDRLLVSVRFAARRDFVGTVETRLFSVKADGSGLVNLVRNAPDGRSMLGTVRSQQLQDRVVDWLPDDGQHVLLQLAEAGGSALPSVYKLNVETGARQAVQGAQRDIYQWITDAQHRVRIGVRQDDDGEVQIRANDPDGKNWRTLWTFTPQGDAVWPLGFGRDPQELFVRAEHEGRDAVFSVRLDEAGLPRRLRLAHPRFDIEGTLMHSPATGEVVGLRSGGVDGEGDGGEGGDARSELWDPAWRALARGIDQALPEHDNRLLGMSRDEQRYLVYASGNGKPGRYFLGDRGTGALSLLGETHANLPPGQLVGKQRVQIKARDGLTLSAYLTLPAGRRSGDAGPALPLVLLPHGGPSSRDDDDFDDWTEFLANRGLAVLQVNFRGSDGYGRAFKAAGMQRWGLEMQDDLSDAVHWAVAEKIADAARVCIVGASYGGYAALMGAVKTPELYRCAASFAGVSNLPDLVQHASDYLGGRAAAEFMIGDAWRDRERLRATSPALQAERIRAPVLLVHGSDDRVVPVEQSEDMAKALKRAGKPYRYVEQEGGDHYLSRYAHRLEFFTALERFLDDNLKPASR
ncbi:MAG TPA: S9 family peptidase [Ideonella sp.]|nr:S9 family peptidase [Ideonella sp.]